MRIGGAEFKDPGENFVDETPVPDWMNLPATIRAVSLWDSLHDGKVYSIRSNLLDRSMDLDFEIKHLTQFHQLGDEFKFIFHFEGLQSARAVRYAIWPGGCSIPSGMSVEEQRKIVAEYQAKWREESASWTQFEASIQRDDEQVFDISDAVITASSSGPVALKICGHLNHASYYEVYLRFDFLDIGGDDSKHFTLEEFMRLGECYWAARSAH